MSDKTWVEKWKEAENDPYKTPFPMAKEMAHKLDEYEAKEKESPQEEGSHAIDLKEDEEEELDRKVKAANEKIRREAKEKAQNASERAYFAAHAPVAPKWFKPIIDPEQKSPMPMCHNDDEISRYHRERVFQWPWYYSKMVRDARPKDD